MELYLRCVDALGLDNAEVDVHGRLVIIGVVGRLVLDREVVASKVLGDARASYVLRDRFFRRGQVVQEFPRAGVVVPDVYPHVLRIAARVPPDPHPVVAVARRDVLNPMLPAKGVVGWAVVNLVD
ncbi:hypothetical protein ES703_52643 [subsurface metagenome]